MTRISTNSLFKADHEYNAETWWDAARQSATCPKALRQLIHGHAEEVGVPSDQTAACLAWCESLPGWSGGPEHAEFALNVVEDSETA